MSEGNEGVEEFSRAKELRWKQTESSGNSVSHLFCLDGMELHFEDIFPFPVDNEYLAYSLAVPKILNICLFSEPSEIVLPAGFKFMVNEEWFKKTLKQVYNYSILLGTKPEYPRLEVSSGRGIKKIWRNMDADTNRVLSLLSFGKDSLLNTLIAKTLGFNVTFLTFRDELFGEEYYEQLELKMCQRRMDAAKYVNDKHGLEGYFVSTKLHYVPMKEHYFANMFALNVLNGYFCALPFCEEYGYGIISAGNEYSCNLDVEREFGATLHINFGKTVWFARLFKRFLRSLHPDLRFYSFVEPFVDWETQALLAKVDPGVIPFQTSCESVSCNNCDKCMVMWLVSKIFRYSDRLSDLKEMTKKQINDILEDSTLGVHAGVAWCLRHLDLLDDRKTVELADLYNLDTLDERLGRCLLPKKVKKGISEILRATRLGSSIRGQFH